MSANVKDFLDVSGTARGACHLAHARRGPETEAVRPVSGLLRLELGLTSGGRLSRIETIFAPNPEHGLSSTRNPSVCSGWLTLGTQALSRLNRRPSAFTRNGWR